MALLLRVTPYPRMDAAFFRMKAGRAGLNVSIIGETLEELGF